MNPESKSVKNCIRLMSALLISAVILNCAVLKFSEQDKAHLSNSLIVVEVPHQKMDRIWDPQIPSEPRRIPAEYGAIGVLVDELTKEWSAKLDKWIEDNEIKKKHLYYDAMGWLLAVNFRREFANALEKELNEVAWIESKRCDKESKLSESQLRNRIKASPFDAMIYVKAHYDWVKNCRCIKIFADYAVYDKKHTRTPYYESHQNYLSCTDNYPSRDLNLNSWVENSGAKIKMKMKEGIEILAHNIRTDFESE